MAITQRYEEHLDCSIIGKYLDHWHVISGRADKYIGWVEVKCDVERVVLNLRPVLQDIFTLYCEQGWAVNEIARLRGCKIRSVLNRYYELRCAIYDAMSNQEYRTPPQSRHTYRLDSWECDGMQPVGENCL